MKKVLFVVNAFRTGGVATVLTNIANALAERDYEITIAVTSNDISASGDLLPQIKLKHKDEPAFWLFKKIPYIRNFYESGQWSLRKTPEKLYKYFVGIKEKYDVEIAFFFGRPLKTVYGSQNPYSKKICWVHTDYEYSTGWKMGFKDVGQCKTAYDCFNEIVCVSGGVKKSFEKVLGKKENIRVIYNLSDVNKIMRLADKPIKTEKNKFTFVAVGRLSEEKGFINLLKAIKEVNKVNNNYDVWIVGDGNERDKLENFISGNHLENVYLIGEKSNPYPYIKNADALVSCSLHEAYGITVAEAMILERPVICTKCAGTEELLDGGKYGILVENSANGISEGMFQILSNNKKYSEMKELARLRSSIFDSEKIMSEIEELII